MLLVLNWDFFLPRYLYPTIPGLMLLAAVSIGRLRGGARALTASAAVITALLAVWWGESLGHNHTLARRGRIEQLPATGDDLHQGARCWCYQQPPVWNHAAMKAPHR